MRVQMSADADLRKAESVSLTGTFEPGAEPAVVFA